MSRQPRSDAVESLLNDLDKAIQLLDSAGEEQWHAWLVRGRAQVASGDAHGLDYQLRGVGDVGSFNDLVLSQPGELGGRRQLAAADDRRELRESSNASPAVRDNTLLVAL